jgi:hypothetical protein
VEWSMGRACGEGSFIDGALHYYIHAHTTYACTRCPAAPPSHATIIQELCLAHKALSDWDAASVQALRKVRLVSVVCVVCVACVACIRSDVRRV